MPKTISLANTMHITSLLYKTLVLYDAEELKNGGKFLLKTRKQQIHF